uniref:Putative loganic acid O-methyltransferase n=1 Tax=Uncaria tomentosa TaxID=128375 RepID=A0A4Y5UXU5_9GENT|nr:putative loganic acid O-methyltransferase [Uncaria tomentosa]
MAPTMDTVPTVDVKEMPEEAHPMNGGDDLNSYSQNSCYQKGVIDAAKTVILEAVTEKLDLENNANFDPSKPFRIADFGCSTGPNTYFAMQNIVEAVDQKYKSQLGKSQPEFHVFFNDHVNNDFNILFRSLPQDREYFAAGVPGSFYTRVFPKASLHFAHCSYALHWLSKVPNEIQDKNSPAYNKGRIHYTGTEKHVVKAYFSQFQKDMGSFLKARAQEIVGGGLMVIQIPGLPSGEVLFSRTGAGMLHALLGSSLMELVNLGVITEESVDSFNLPQYHPSIEEMEMVIEMNNNFTLEKAGALNHPMKNLPFDVQMTSLQVRAVMEGILTDHFGENILDPLFEIYTKKLQENYNVFDKDIRRDADLFLVLKRKSN